jgi:hypothetical protein
VLTVRPRARRPLGRHFFAVQLVKLRHTLLFAIKRFSVSAENPLADRFVLHEAFWVELASTVLALSQRCLLLCLAHKLALQQQLKVL